MSSRDECNSAILEHVMNWDARSKMVTIAASDVDMYDDNVRTAMRDCLAACHCAKAVLELHAEMPNHPQVKLAITQGALHVVHMKCGVPEESVMPKYVKVLCTCCVYVVTSCFFPSLSVLCCRMNNGTS